MQCSLGNQGGLARKVLFTYIRL